MSLVGSLVNEVTSLKTLLKTLAKKSSKALNYGNFSSVVRTNEQCVFLRQCDDERVLVAINAAEHPYFASFNMGCDSCVDMINGETIALNNGMELAGYGAYFLKIS